MRWVRDLAIYTLVIVIGFVVRRLSRSASLWLGARIGNLVYRSVKRRRQIALSNLRMALGSEKGDKELKQIACRSFQNMGKTLVEFLSTPKYSLDRLLNLVQIEGAENFRRVMATGKGAVGVSAHFGNWELIFQAMTSLDNRLLAIVQPFKHHRLDELINSYRTKYGGKVVHRRMAVKESLRLLRQGWCVAILGDQNAGDNGVFIDFFGIPASTSRGPVTLALRTGASIFSILDIRQDDDSHVITISEPLELEISGDQEKDMEVNTAKFVKQLEGLVRKYPCQWLWMHNRWKTRPSEEARERRSKAPRIQQREPSIQYPASSIQKSVLILSDGKPGHYNQSLGIIDRANDVSVKTIQVRFKRKWRDDLLRVLTRLTAGIMLDTRYSVLDSRYSLPRSPASSLTRREATSRACGKLIKAVLSWAMERRSAAAALEAGHFDAILSTGSSVAAPNLLLGQLTGAKTAVCTRPSPVGINHFDLAILPEHMKPRRLDGIKDRSTYNVVMTLGVPNRITPEYVGTAGRDLAKKLNVVGKRVIGLLLGGDDRHYSIPPGMVLLLCDALLDICEESNANLALTTSRRTDPRSEDIIRRKLLVNPRCCFSVLPPHTRGEPQQENPVPGILGLSDVTIVTEDSFSMVCEAASSGRKIVILEVERKKHGHLKRQRVYQLLAERGYAKRADMSNLRSVVLSLAGDMSKPKVLDDAQTAAKALRDLIN